MLFHRLTILSLSTLITIGAFTALSCTSSSSSSSHSSSPPSTPPSATLPHSRTTSTGEELRIGIPYHATPPHITLTPLQQHSADAHTTPRHREGLSCPQGQHLASPYVCIPLRAFSIPSHSHSPSSPAVSAPQTLPIQTPSITTTHPILPLPPALPPAPAPSSTAPGTQTFLALTPPTVLSSTTLSRLRPIYALQSPPPHSWLYLTSALQERTLLLSQNYTELGIMFYVSPGKGYGNAQLYRFRTSKQSSMALPAQGPWHYSFSPTLDHGHLDGSLGAVQWLQKP